MTAKWLELAAMCLEFCSFFLVAPEIIGEKRIAKLIHELFSEVKGFVWMYICVYLLAGLLWLVALVIGASGLFPPTSAEWAGLVYPLIGGGIVYGLIVLGIKWGPRLGGIIERLLLRLVALMVDKRGLRGSMLIAGMLFFITSFGLKVYLWSLRSG